MQDRWQETHIMAQEEGLVLSSFFEFQAFAMLDYLRMKSAQNLPAKDTMTTVLINTSYIFIAHTVCVFCFFSEGNLIGCLCGLSFPISSLRQRQRFRESPSTSLLSLPFFTNISRFSGWAVILSKDVDHYLKPINNLFILSFLSFKLILLTEKYCFQNEFV